MVVKPASDFSAEHGVSFVSVTQQFNTTTSMGRLTLNVLLSFAQFEREITSERIRDKIASSKRKGLWVGGMFVSGARAGRGGRWCAGAATLGLCFVAGLFCVTAARTVLRRTVPANCSVAASMLPPCSAASNNSSVARLQELRS